MRVGGTGCANPLPHRPATVGIDDLVDLGHQVNGFLEGSDDALVVGDIPGPLLSTCS